MSELADYLGNKYGGWYRRPAAAMRRATASSSRCRWPPSATPSSIATAGSRKPASRSSRPRPTTSSSCARRCRRPAIRSASPMAMASATATTMPIGCCGATAARWSTRAARSRSTARRPLKAIEYAMELYKTFIPGTEGWLDVNNNRAFLAGEIVGHRQRHLRLLLRQERPEAGRDRQGHPHHQPADRPGRQVGRAVPGDERGDLQLHQVPERGRKAYLRFMFEEAQMRSLDHAAPAAIAASTLKAYANNPVWTADPNHAPYAKASETLRPTAMPARSATPRPRSWRTTSWSTCSPRPSPASRRRKPRWSAPSSGPTATTASDRLQRAGAVTAAPACADAAGLHSREATMAEPPSRPRRARAARASVLARLGRAATALGFLFMLPAAVLAAAVPGLSAGARRLARLHR